MVMKKYKKVFGLILAVSLVTVSFVGCSDNAKEKSNSTAHSLESGKITITNVSYDPTRELYQKYDELFEKYYHEKHGSEIEVIQSHGGSGKQARSVIEGADADVVTLALEHDITLIEQAGLIENGWLKEFDLDSSPYTSTIVFLVRKGNPKQLRDWNDLIKDGVEIINPDPKSSGGACWNFLAAWKYALDNHNNDESEAKGFVKKLYENVTVMDSGARGATTTFVENGQGDVLIAWENEAINSVAEYPDEYEIVTPSISILAQPSVAVVDVNANKNGTQDAAKEYLEYLYTEDAQKIIGENGYRPTNETILKSFSDKFDLNVKLCKIDDFGGWDAAYEKFFDDGAIFDEIYGN